MTFMVKSKEYISVTPTMPPTDQRLLPSSRSFLKLPESITNMPKFSFDWARNRKRLSL